MNTNTGRLYTESLPPRGTNRTRYACAICVHPFLFAFICVFPCLPDQRRERLPAAIVTPRRNDPDRVQSIRMAIAPRGRVLALVWLRRLGCAVLDRRLACTGGWRPNHSWAADVEGRAV